MVADFQTIREITTGRSVVATTHEHDGARPRFSGATHALHYYLAGSPIAYNGDLYHTDFLITRNRVAGVATLTPDNRTMYLYDTASLIEMYQSAYRQLRSGAPLRRSYFDLYLHDPGGTGTSTLSYVKEPCNKHHRMHQFWLNITPVDPEAIAAEDRTEHGTELRTFDFYEESGLAFRGTCMVTIDLPDYEIAHITTGQYKLVPGERRAWSVAFNPEKSL